MKRILSFIFILLILAVSVHAQQDGKTLELTVNGVHLGASYESVIRKFGSPAREIRDSAGACVGGKSRKVVYPGLTLSFTNDEAKPNKFTIYELEVTSSRWNVSGFTVGATEAAIERRLGKFTTQDDKKGETIWYYYLQKEDTGGSHFFFRHGKVVRFLSFYSRC